MATLSTSSGHSTSLFHQLLSVITWPRFASLTAQSKMAPTIGLESASTPSLAHYGRSPLSSREGSATSLQSMGDNVTLGSSPAYSMSSLSIPFEDGDVDVVRVEGLRHSDIRLEARRYKSNHFASQLLDILHSVRAPSWTHPEITPRNIKIQKVSGSLTNAVFFISCPAVPGTRILLLRIYGPSSGSLISRPRELHTLHALSSQYRIGPRVYGTFENGRVEEYFDSITLTAADLRDKKISSWIGARMAELHGVSIEAVEEAPFLSEGSRKGWQSAAEKNVKSWLGLALEVLALPSAPAMARQRLDLDTFGKEWEQYTHWLHEKEGREGPSKRVFAHNDTQYGNLLRLKTLKEGLPEHRQIIVVDFEYASPNPAAFDIANHFHEWTANYHSETPHMLNPALYPSIGERRNYYRAYLAHVPRASTSSATMQPGRLSNELLEVEMQKLEDQVQAWSPASHAMWAVWGVVQAREFIEGRDGEPEFDYLGYAQCRMDGFRREIRALGLSA